MILSNMALPDLEQRVCMVRTLVEVVGTDAERGMVDLVVPGWKPEVTVTIAAARIKPPELLDHVRDGGMLLAKVNLATEDPRRLMFQDFTMVSPPVSESELG